MRKDDKDRDGSLPDPTGRVRSTTNVCAVNEVEVRERRV
jgi:hypothetical protein